MTSPGLLSALPVLGAAAPTVLAHSGLVASLPLAVPALLVVLAIGGVVWRDRHHPRDDGDAGSGAASGRGTPPGR